MKYEFEDGRLNIHTEGTYAGKTIDTFLEDFRQSRKHKYLLIQNRQILHNGNVVKTTTESLKRNDILTLIIPEEEIDWKKASHPCDIVYEDDFVYIVHKEPHTIIHGDPDDRLCLNAQAAAWQELHGIHTPVRPIHRLDEDTTGLVLYSKIPFFQPWFDEQLSEKKITRHYKAICTGKSDSVKPGDTFTIQAKLGRDRHVSNKYRVSSTGKAAVTEVKCLSKFGKYILFGCTLQTGRTHQIRVHLSSHRFPIVNDPIYGNRSTDFEQMGLWADSITFRNPITKKKHRIHDYPNPDYEVFRETE